MRISLVVLVLAFAGLLAVDLAPSSTPRCGRRARARSAAGRTGDRRGRVRRNGWIVRVSGSCRSACRRRKPRCAAHAGPTRAGSKGSDTLRRVRDARSAQTARRGSPASRTTLGSAQTARGCGDRSARPSVIRSSWRSHEDARDDLARRPTRYGARTRARTTTPTSFVASSVASRALPRRSRSPGSLDYLTEQALRAFQGGRTLRSAGPVITRRMNLQGVRHSGARTGRRLQSGPRGRCNRTRRSCARCTRRRARSGARLWGTSTYT